jgi:serine/threonine-protein kinase
VRQADRMVALESRFPAVLHGGDKPKDAAEGLVFAAMANTTKQFGASARLYAEAFRAGPALAQDLEAAHRYSAACAAVLAGAGKGKDQPPLDEPARAKWRQQALDWLRADLALRTRQVKSGSPGVKAEVNGKLQFWKVDRDLAGIRDETALKALPEDEQKACRTLWAEVDALLAKARAGTAP